MLCIMYVLCMYVQIVNVYYVTIVYKYIICMHTYGCVRIHTYMDVCICNICTYVHCMLLCIYDGIYNYDDMYIHMCITNTYTCLYISIYHTSCM